MKKTSKYRGVFYCNTTRKWFALVTIKTKRHRSIGFATEIEAAREYNKMQVNLFAGNARLIHIEEEKKYIV